MFDIVNVPINSTLNMGLGMLNVPINTTLNTGLGTLNVMFSAIEPEHHAVTAVTELATIMLIRFVSFAINLVIVEGATPARRAMTARVIPESSSAST
jgi:hypothetical protein